MAKFFRYFPITSYTLDNSNVQIVKNILSKVSFEKGFRENSILYYEYLIEEGDTPDIVSHKLYGDSESHWIILLLNELLHPQFDWPLDSQSFIKYIDKKYQSQQYANNSTEGAGTTWANSNIKEYRKIETKKNNRLDQEMSVEKFVITSSEYANTTSSSSNYTLSDGTPITISTSKETLTYFQYENEVNENKRSIKVLKPEFIPVIQEELIRVFK